MRLIDYFDDGAATHPSKVAFVRPDGSIRAPKLKSLERARLPLRPGAPTPCTSATSTSSGPSFAIIVGVLHSMNLAADQDQHDRA